MIEKQQAKADFDSKALASDRHVHPPPAITSRGYPRWCGSEAERLLKADIDDGNLTGIKPKDLHQSRPEYQAFPLKVFRDHIAQETRSRLGRSYWQNRKQQGK